MTSYQKLNKFFLSYLGDIAKSNPTLTMSHEITFDGHLKLFCNNNLLGKTKMHNGRMVPQFKKNMMNQLKRNLIKIYPQVDFSRLKNRWKL